MFSIETNGKALKRELEFFIKYLLVILFVGFVVMEMLPLVGLTALSYWASVKVGIYVYVIFIAFRSTLTYNGKV